SPDRRDLLESVRPLADRNAIPRGVSGQPRPAPAADRVHELAGPDARTGRLSGAAWTPQAVQRPPVADRRPAVHAPQPRREDPADDRRSGDSRRARLPDLERPARG